MFGYDNVRTFTVAFADPTSDKALPIWRVPSRITKAEIVAAWAVLDTTVTLGNGTGVILQLLDYGTAMAGNLGTVAGTLGGTAVTWTAGTPKDFTIADGTLDANDYLVLNYDEEGSIAPLNVTVYVAWVAGVAA